MAENTESWELPKSAQNHDYWQERLNQMAQAQNFLDAGKMLAALQREMSWGSGNTLFTDAFKGFNRRQQGNALPLSTDNQGLVFFTRPDLNLSHYNIAQKRIMSVLDTTVRETYQSAIRCMLDPRASHSFGGNNHPVFDNRQAFLTLLSNAMVSMSGWPDMQTNIYSTTEGAAKEVWMMADSMAENNGRFTLSVDFMNMAGNPVTLLLATWIRYMGYVYTGVMHPHLENLRYNRIDYMTRIYRIITDVSGQYVTHIAATGVAMPTALNIGAQFNYDRERVAVRENDRISMAFECIGAIYNDPILIEDFNLTAGFCNGQMAGHPADNGLVRIHPEHYNITNYRGFPRIDMDTNRLEWWIEKPAYDQIIADSTNLRNP